MKVEIEKPEAQWRGQITITFDTKKEAEIFFSVFNTGKIADAVEKFDCHLCETIYEQAESLDVDNDQYVTRISENLRNQKY